MKFGKPLLAISKLMSRKGLYEFLKQELHKLPANSRVLNIGAGGEIEEIVREVASKRDFVVTSSDFDAARKPDVVDDVTKSNFQNGVFDAIVMMEVLEHVTEPTLAARELERILRPGGRLIFSTPFIFPIHDRPYDFYRYTKYGLGYLFRDFDNLQIRQRNSWTEAILVLIARLTSLGDKVGAGAALIAIPCCVILYPFALICAWFVRTDFLTTGYVLSANRRK